MVIILFNMKIRLCFLIQTLECRIPFYFFNTDYYTEGKIIVPGVFSVETHTKYLTIYVELLGYNVLIFQNAV